jgi:CheY-like chemotaxis protein
MMNKKPIVLVVDDDYTSLFLSTLVVEETKLSEHVYTARNGEEALCWLENRRGNLPQEPASPTLIFLDINMPVMNGFELLETLKTRPDIDMSRTHVVMLSSSTHSQDKEKALSHAVTGFIQKPLSREKLKQLPINFLPLWG